MVWRKNIDKWELYNVAKDRSETQDLSAKMPQKVTELLALHDQWSKKVGVQTGGKSKNSE